MTSAIDGMNEQVREDDGSVSVIEVGSRQDLRRFLEVPYGVFGAHDAWRPVLRTVEKKRLGPKRLYRDTQTLKSWIAAEDGRDVGRIVACVERLPETVEGRIGMFSCVDEPAVAGALLETAARWARGEGAQRVVGPSDFGPNEPSGALVEGFEQPPTLGTLWNPPYYDDLFQGAGWRPVVDLLGFRITHEAALTPRQQAAADMAKSRLKVRARMMLPTEYVTLLPWFFESSRAPWPVSWSAGRVSQGEFREVARLITRFIVPQLTLVAEAGPDHEPAGVLLTLMDFNGAMRRLRDGRLLPLGWLRLMGASKDIQGVKMSGFGVFPRWEGKGVSFVLLDELKRRAAELDRFQWADVSWVESVNTKMRALLREAGVDRPDRRWRIYEWPGPAGVNGSQADHFADRSGTVHG